MKINYHLYCMVLPLFLNCCGQEEQLEGENSSSDQTSNIKEPVLTCASTNDAGCQTFGDTEYAYRCEDGVVTKKLACGANEFCGIDKDAGPFCDFKLPDNAAHFCQERKDSSFCQQIGEDIWLLVCQEDGELYLGAYGTTNCTGYGANCVENSDDFGSYAICKSK